LAVILDLFSRRVVGHACAATLATTLVAEALAMACGRCSRSRRGDCYDNAAVKSFFGTLKTELIHGRRYATRAEARADIFEYVEVFYNRERRHSTLGYVSPPQFEAQHPAARMLPQAA
jgi:putative transposase